MPESYPESKCRIPPLANVRFWHIATLPQEFMSATPPKADKPQPTRMTLSGPTVRWLSRAINVQAEASRSRSTDCTVVWSVDSGALIAKTVHHRASFACSKVGLTPLDAEF